MTKLRQRMLEELQRRNYSPETTRVYLLTVENFSRYFGKSPDKLKQEDMRRYQLHLLHDRKLAVGSIIGRIAALRFFFVKVLGRPYRQVDLVYPKQPFRLPTILSEEEVARLLASANSSYHFVIVMTLYSTGLRRAELSRLKVEDIDSERMVVHVRQGKGSRDRDVPLSPKLLEVLRDYWRLAQTREILVPQFAPDPSWKTHHPQDRLVCRPAGRPPCRHQKEDISAYAAPQLGHALAGARNGSANHPAPAGSCRSGVHKPLPASVPGAHAAGGEPHRFASGSRSGTLSPFEKAERRMNGPTVEVADILRARVRGFLQHRRIGFQKLKVLRAIMNCRTAALGGHIDRCAQCGRESGISFNSCRNRHCPKCQTQARRRWLQAREAELLPTPYFHVVFTLPHQFHPFFFQNPGRTLYPAVSQRGRYVDRGCCQSETTRRTDRFLRHPAYLESEPPVPSPHPLCRAGRRVGPGSIRLDSGLSTLLPAQAGARPSLPWQVSGWTRPSHRQRFAGTLRIHSTPG